MHYWSVKGGKSGFGNSMMGLSTSKGRGISARPVAADGVVYVYDAWGTVSGYKVANSGATWHVSAYPTSARDQVSGGGLAVSGGRVYAATGYGELIAIDVQSSSLLWRMKLDAPARSAPAVGGGKVVVTAQSGAVQAFDAVTGAAAWRASTDTSGAALLGASSPAISGEDRRGDWFERRRAGARSRHRHRQVAGVDHRQTARSRRSRHPRRVGEPVIHGDTVYATGIGGSLVAIDMKSGDIRWQQSIGSAETPIVSAARSSSWILKTASSPSTPRPAR